MKRIEETKIRMSIAVAMIIHSVRYGLFYTQLKFRKCDIAQSSSMFMVVHVFCCLVL